MNNNNQLGAGARIFLILAGIGFFVAGLYGFKMGADLMSFYRMGSDGYQSGQFMIGIGVGGAALGFFFFIGGIIGKRLGGNNTTYHAPQYNPYNQNQYNNNPTGYTSSYSNSNTQSTNAPSATDTLSKDLKALADLRDKDLLTDEEYQAKRRKLLGL